MNSTAHKTLLSATNPMPMRLIVVNDKPYLERYYVGEAANGSQLWLHHFLSDDQDQFFHSHPWYADSLIILGGYTEESMPTTGKPVINVARFVAGDSNMINPNTLHRIIRVDKNTWSLVTVKPGWGVWYFINEEGEIIEMGKTHGLDWYKNYMSRNEYNSVKGHPK